jgi:DNA-binding GntR family transcriptional regulator
MIAFKRTTLAEHCYESVLEQLLDGSLRPGEQLPIETLCTSLGVSRHPLMEAVKRLEYEGFITIAPQVGCRVVETDASDVHDFFGFFAAAEALCARHAAERRTPEGARRMAELCRASEALCAQEDERERSRGYRALDERLHAEIRRVGRSRIVDQISSRLWHRADFLVTSIVGPHIHSERLDTAHAEHERIVHAVAAGDGDAAARLMQDHVLGFSNLVAQHATGANA